MELYVLTSRGMPKASRRKVSERTKHAQMWIPVMERFPDGENVIMATTLASLAKFGVTLDPKAKKRLRRQWGNYGSIDSPLDELTYLAMRHAVGLETDTERMTELADELIRTQRKRNEAVAA